MFDHFNKLDKYPAFTMTNGMILHEMMHQKNIGFDELFPILGPKSLVIEIVNGKRSLKHSQIKQLSELFAINQDVFTLENEKVENSELGLEESLSSENSFLNEEDSTENNQENFESHITNENDNNEDDKNQLENFNDFQNHEMISPWED
jgi:hypothetical protein